MSSNNTHTDHPVKASGQDEPLHIDETLIDDDDEVHEPAEDLKPAPTAEDSQQHVSSEMYHYLYFDDNDCFFATHFS